MFGGDLVYGITGSYYIPDIVIVIIIIIIIINERVLTTRHNIGYDMVTRAVIGFMNSSCRTAVVCE